MTAVATRSRVLNNVLKTHFRRRQDDVYSPLCSGLCINEIWSLHIFPLCDEKTRRRLQLVSRAWCVQLRMYEKIMPARVQRNVSADTLVMYAGITQFAARLPSSKYHMSDLSMLHHLQSLSVVHRDARVDIGCLAMIPTLRHLAVAGSYKSIAGIDKLTQLHTLNIMFCEESIDGQLLQLRHTLRALTLFPARLSIRPLTDAGTFVSPNTIKRMQNLNAFGISGSSVDKEKWRLLVRAFACRKATSTSLALHDDRELQNYGSFYEVASTTSTLSLKRSTCMDFLWLNVQLTRFSNLVHISFRDFNSPTATDVRIRELEIPTLRSIDIVCDVGDMIVRMFSGTTLSRLERLAIYACDYRALQQHAKSLKQLEYLSMKQQNVVNTAIATLRLPKLHYIEMAICSDFKAFTSGPAPEKYCFGRGFYATVPFELEEWLKHSTEVQIPLPIETFSTTSMTDENGSSAPIVLDDQMARTFLRKPCVMNEQDYANMGVRFGRDMNDDESSFIMRDSSDSSDSLESSSSSDEWDSSESSSEYSSSDESSSDSQWHNPTLRKRFLPPRASAKRSRVLQPSSLDDDDDDEARYRPRRRRR